MTHPVAERVIRSVIAAHVAFACSGVAHAADPEFQVTGETSLGYLDSNQSPPDGSDGTVRTHGLVWVLAPGLALGYVSQKSQHRLGYRYQHDFLFGETTTSSSTN
ncbi:MAG TPA: hypothetical protein VMS65_05665, partial [Polyangiaceae bacterium]|nr:hypothetical protein [Polyangiaceae bacterium]